MLSTRGDPLERSAIEWTESTWNPTTGCTKVSSGCAHCYAERMTARFPAAYPNGFALTLRTEVLEIPLRWRRPRMVFVNSMSDLFHVDVPESYIVEVFEVMRLASQHTFQLLTKRAERLARLALRLPWPSNVWAGVSVEDRSAGWRASCLRRVPAPVRFLSAEPLLGPLGTIDMTGIDWVIAGGESQPGARPAHLSWFRSLRDRCRADGVPFFLKQLGGFPDKRGGDKAVLDGHRYQEMPSVRQVPLAVEIDGADLAPVVGSA